MIVTSKQANDLREKGLSYSEIAKKLKLVNKGIAYRLVKYYNVNPEYSEKIGNKQKYTERIWKKEIVFEKFSDEWIKTLYDVIPKYIRNKSVYGFYSNEGQYVYDKILDFAYTTKFENDFKRFWNTVKFMVKYPHHKKHKQYFENVNYHK